MSEPVSNAYTLPSTVQAVVDAAVAYEQWQGKWYDYTVASGEKPAKQQRALIEAVRKHRAALTAASDTVCSACHGEREVSEHECCGNSTNGECCGQSVEVRVPCLFCGDGTVNAASEGASAPRDDDTCTGCNGTGYNPTRERPCDCPTTPTRGSTTSTGDRL